MPMPIGNWSDSGDYPQGAEHRVPFDPNWGKPMTAGPTG